MFEKRWVYSNKKIAHSGNKYFDDLPEFIQSILANRGIAPDEAKDYFKPVMEELNDPFLLKDMDAAVDRILDATSSEEKITVFGDYDVDGITATVILYDFLKNFLQLDVEYMLPDRLTTGYGINPEAVEEIAKSGTTLIITVDNGIRAFEAVEKAHELGMDIIITDHHQCGDTIPECCAVIDSMRIDCEFPFKYLAGVGVAYMLIMALASTLAINENIEQYLPVVAVGTLGDSVRLTGDNRRIVRYGLEHLIDGRWIGLIKLYSMLLPKAQGLPTSRSIVYSVVPKLNAAGRMGVPDKAMKLLLSSTEEEAEKYAQELIQCNKERIEKENIIMKQTALVENIRTGKEDSIVITAGDSFHPGVLGIVAAKITEKYSKPAFVMRREGNVLRGSARSVEGFDIFKALTYASEALTQFGGHEMAAGLSMEDSNVPLLIEKLNEYTRINKAERVCPSHIVDYVMDARDATVDNFKSLKAMEPCGEGNKTPLLCLTNLKISKCTKVGSDSKHLKLTFRSLDTGMDIEGMAFNSGAYDGIIGSMDECSVLFNPDVNVWKGKESVSLIIIDIFDMKFDVAYEPKTVYNGGYITARGFVPERSILVAMYKCIRSFSTNRFEFNDLFSVRKTLREKGLPCTWFIIRSGMSIFCELGLLKRISRSAYEIVTVTEKTDLARSSLFNLLNSQ